MGEIVDLDADRIKRLFGSLDKNVGYIEKRLNVKISQNDHGVLIQDDHNGLAKQLITSLISLIDEQIEIDVQTVKRALDAVLSGDDLLSVKREMVAIGAKGRRITCKTSGQRNYVNCINSFDVAFGIGCAGTGKTFLAVACAYSAFKANQVEKIILTRPALEAGEKLGFLPGDLQTKVDPYLRPLYDSLAQTFGQEVYLRLMERGAIEVAPLAYMRGRTLNNAFIILDEAQNATIEQMKMFLTRLGKNSKMVITGDITQVDLPEKRMSGLAHATKILNQVEGVGIAYLTQNDVVRHELVSRIIQAYEKNGESK